MEVSFFAIALPIGYVVYHGTTGEWLQLQDLLSDGEGRVRLVGIILSYIVLLKTLFPLRLGATLFLTTLARTRFPTLFSPSLIAPMRRMSMRTDE